MASPATSSNYRERSRREQLLDALQTARTTLRMCAKGLVPSAMQSRKSLDAIRQAWALDKSLRLRLQPAATTLHAIYNGLPPKHQACLLADRQLAAFVIELNEQQKEQPQTKQPPTGDDADNAYGSGGAYESGSAYSSGSACDSSARPQALTTHASA